MTPINVEWSGNWYQTFRVFRLAMVERVRVVPYFVVNPSRRTSLLELESLWHLRRALKRVDREAAERIEPLRLQSRYEVEASEPITKAFLRLNEEAPLEERFEWLARYALQHDIDDLEVCLRAKYPEEAFLRDRVTHVDPDGTGGYWVLDEQYRDGDLSIFSRFRFPILYTPESEMRRQADEMGLSTILDEAWFCEKTNRGEPCGVCGPCRYALEEGMTHRFSRAALLRNHLDGAMSRAASAARSVLSLPRRVARRLVRHGTE